MNPDAPSALDPAAPSAAPPQRAPKAPPQGRPGPPRRRHWLWLLILVVLAAGVYVRWPKRNTAQGGAGNVKGGVAGRQGRGVPPVQVVGAKARRGDIPVYLTALGSVTPIYTVEVKTRVDGQLMEVHYKEGDLVRKGEPLLEIDPRPFQVQLTQAEGQLTRDEALLANARIDLARYQTLLTQNAIPEQQVATQEALVKQDEGIVKTDEGMIASAKLNMTYSHITAPITGRVGLRLVDPGNIVHASDTNPLLVITQLQPISVIFTLAEDQLPIVQRRFRGGQRLEMDAYDRTYNTRLARGVLATMDNQIDQTTGTVKLRATFDNRDNVLFPNQFVNARLLVQLKQNVTLVPAAAIQRSAQSTYVFLVKPDSTVTVRTISTGTTEGEDTEVTSGVAPGDVIVMTGVDKLQEGSKVVVHFPGEAGPRGNRAPNTAQPPAGSPYNRKK